MGWIAAGLVVSFGLGIFISDGLKPEQTSLPLYLSALFSLLLGLYAFTLPHTPPKGSDTPVSLNSIVGVDALKHLGNRSFYIFLMCSLLVSIPLAAYFNFTQVFLIDTDFTNVAAIQTIGQFSEVIFMLLMPFFFIRLGVKWMLAIGMLAWVGRYFLFAFGAPDQIVWMILMGVIIHGICYDFFFVTGQIYTDKKAPGNIRAQAQGLLVLFTLGIGMLIGAQVAGYVEKSASPAAVAEYGDVVAAKEKELTAVRERIEESKTDKLVAQAELLEKEKGEARMSQLKAMEWKKLWMFPAIFAAGVLGIFLLFFKDKTGTEPTEA